VGYSRTIAGLITVLAGLAGITLSDSTALEVAGIVLQLGGIGYAWYARFTRGDITPAGVKRADVAR
jgi:hypothetical protein